MAVAETIIFELGAAIAKSLLQLWTKDVPVLPDAASSLTDVVKNIVSDKAEQRRIVRGFEDIGDKLGKSLQKIFEAEGRSLDSAGQEAVALAVKDTFNRVPLTSKVVMECDNDPQLLVKYVSERTPNATRDFSEPETTLYNRIVKESCNYIVDVASKLPLANEAQMAELLTRERKIIDLTSEVLENTRRIWEQLDPFQKAQQFEGEYRQAIARKLDRLELFGADVNNKYHNLSIAYVSLQVEQDKPTKSTVTPSKALALPDPDATQARAGQSEAPQVEKALQSSPRLFIVGEAGSGKTTLLQWIAVRAANREFKDELKEWNDYLPFYIRLREYAKTALPTPKEFVTKLLPSIADTIPDTWVRDKLKDGRAFVLIDGLDEVAEPARAKVWKWLRELTETFPKVRFVVTSRPYALEKGFELEGFAKYQLQPMALANVFAFIEHWHQAVGADLREAEEKTQLAESEQALKRQVEEQNALRNLAINPLLCAMLCALNQQRRRQLPTERIELYEACCHLLIERRDKEREVDLSDYPVLSYNHKVTLLEDIAYWMIKNGWSEAGVSEVDERISKKLPNLPNISKDTTGPGVRRLLTERCGVVRTPVEGKLDFTHRTFEEYFAAKAALNEDDWGLLVNNADNDQWREVIILAAGRATKKVRERLIEGLIKRGDKETKKKHQFHLLAVACLETSVELSREIRAEVEGRLGQLVPPQNFRDAKALAAAGEMVVPYLKMPYLRQKKSKASLFASEAAACVRTLSLIGGKAALEALQGYVPEKRAGVVEELFKAWDRFERGPYAEQILCQLDYVGHDWSGSGLVTLEGFQHFSKLTKLDLSFNSYIDNLIPLTTLTNLTTLDLSGCNQISDFSPIVAHLSNLTYLNLERCGQISDLSPLAHLSNLTYLNLERCGQISDLAPLAHLSNLTYLNLNFCDQISDLSPLAHLSKLTDLYLLGCQQVSDIKPLAHLSNLTSLDLTYCNQISDLAPLAHLSNLTTLDLSGCRQISDLSPLAHLSKLTELNLSLCERITDFSPLANLSNLTELDLRGCNQISDFSPLAGLVNLTNLYLGSCDQINNLTPLANLSNLTTLDLSNCDQISDLEPLAKLTNLVSLNLRNCEQISDLSPLAHLSNLAKLDMIHFDQISDLSPLVHLTNLIELVLAYCDQISDLSPLAHLSNLTYLNLRDCDQITDFTAVFELAKLERLGLSHSQAEANKVVVEALQTKGVQIDL